MRLTAAKGSGKQTAQAAKSAENPPQCNHLHMQSAALGGGPQSGGGDLETEGGQQDRAQRRSAFGEKNHNCDIGHKAVAQSENIKQDVPRLRMGI
jgi:hypothetical protein